MPRSRSFTLGKIVAGAFFVALLGGIALIEWHSPSVQTGILLGGDDDAPRVLPKPTLDNPKGSNALQTAVFAGGCFWGVQAVFEHVHGVRRVFAGYSGGKKDAAQYSLVSTGTTGHAESIQIAFDPGEVTYGELLQIFFSIAHNPTQLNFQGPDVGPQYRSEIFYSDPSQEKIAQAYIAQLNDAKAFSVPVVTRVEPLQGFYAAEEYHQDYLIKHPDRDYIVYFDLPKLANLKRLFPEIYNPAPATATMSSQAVHQSEPPPLDRKI